jgi:hypothetical protein
MCGEKVYTAPPLAKAVARVPQPPLNYGDCNYDDGAKKKIDSQLRRGLVTGIRFEPTLTFASAWHGEKAKTHIWGRLGAFRSEPRLNLEVVVSRYQYGMVGFS